MKKRAESGIWLNAAMPIVLVICALVSMLLIQNEAVERAQQRVYDRLSENERLQRRLIEETISGKYALLETAADLLVEEGEDPETVASILSAAAGGGSFSSVGFANAEGDTVLNSGETTNIADRSYFQTSARGERAMSRIKPGEGKITGKSRFILSVPIDAGEVSGVLFGSFLDDSFRPLLATDTLDVDVYSFICSGDGTVLISSLEDNIGAPVAFDNINDLLENAAAKQGAALAEDGTLQSLREGSVSFTLGEYEGYIVYMPLGLSDWTLFNLVPTRIIEEDTKASTQTGFASLLILLGVSLVLIAAIVIVTNRRAHELRERQQEEVSALTYRAETDSLTGLLNHRATRARIERYLENEGRHGSHALYLIDLDGFKQVNDIYGHPEGDRVIAQKGAEIQRLFRTSDIVGRIGGDEFMVLLKNTANPAITEQKAAELCSVLQSEFGIEEGERIALTASVGVAAYAEGKTFAQLYKAADDALYSAKRSGKDRYVIEQDSEKRT